MPDWIDLTFPLNDQTAIYAEDGYADPPFAATRWSTIAKNRFEVWQLALGTQTGTHIDAPAHFAQGGATIERMQPGDMVGTYQRIDVGTLQATDTAPMWTGASHLFLDARAPHLAPTEALRALIDLPATVWVLAGELRVDHEDPLWLHVTLAQAGKFLAEDLCCAHLGDIPDQGQIATVPLNLTGLSGSPARVLLRG
ncbi:cyclase family protein [Ruegeria sp. 2012CJ41-6]|uniref:Cyclase family protein n=1 Tax=Ruegeria spongiae TaxID=2942209 RepID=A0ABT0Q739_9RHOB|nr:cyclase family protein [Ruegeria spongiae]MCL6285691.1 cyclase family protein [Ruegeria spongiae]